MPSATPRFGGLASTSDKASKCQESQPEQPTDLTFYGFPPHSHDQTWKECTAGLARCTDWGAIDAAGIVGVRTIRLGGNPSLTVESGSRSTGERFNERFEVNSQGFLPDTRRGGEDLGGPTVLQTQASASNA
jgi:hypothetical protein